MLEALSHSIELTMFDSILLQLLSNIQYVGYQEINEDWPSTATSSATSEQTSTVSLKVSQLHPSC